MTNDLNPTGIFLVFAIDPIQHIPPFALIESAPGKWYRFSTQNVYITWQQCLRGCVAQN